ncbi:MAG TPA: YIP1 family protein [Anaerolineales bacterium]|nr:YIP1 family protein [Anaerolineales bacterium]
MNDQMNTPMSPMPGGPTPFYQVWLNALTKPNEQTFIEIANSAQAKASTAYLWIFASSLVQIFLTVLVQGAMMSSMMAQYGGGNTQLGGGMGARLLGAVCGGPIGAAVATLFFAIGMYIVQWIAKMFGGRGTTDQLTYAIASIAAPYSIIAGVLTLLTAIPFAGYCFGAILAIAGIYILVLQVMAVKAVNQFGWGPAIGSLFIPGLVVGLICACLIGGTILFFVPLIRDASQSIN